MTGLRSKLTSSFFIVCYYLNRNSIDYNNYNNYDENYQNNIANLNGFHPSIRSYPIEDEHDYNDYGYSERSENTYERNSRYLSDSHDRNNSHNNEFSF